MTTVSTRDTQLVSLVSTDWNGFTHIRQPLVSKAWTRPFHDHTFCTSRCCFTLFIVWTFTLVKTSTIMLDSYSLIHGDDELHCHESPPFWNVLTWGCCWLFLLVDALDKTGTSVIDVRFGKVWAISISSSVIGTFTVPLTKSTTALRQSASLSITRPLKRKLRRRWYCSLSFEAYAKPRVSSLTDFKFAERSRIASWSWACEKLSSRWSTLSSRYWTRLPISSNNLPNSARTTETAAAMTFSTMPSISDSPIRPACPILTSVDCCCA